MQEDTGTARTGKRNLNMKKHILNYGFKMNKIIKETFNT